MKLKGCFRISSLFVLLQLVFTTASLGNMTPYRVSVDVTGLSNIQLEFALYDNNGVIGDSYAMIDNVAFEGTLLEDFEGGTIGAFDSSLNPDSVNAVDGVMRLDEDPWFTPTLAFRDFAGLGTLLEFDLQFFGNSEPGFWGLDQVVVSLLDSTTLSPLVSGLTGFGDVLAIDASGVFSSSEVSLAAVPAPGAAFLAMLGLGCVGAWRRRAA